jgi:adenylate cyclase
MQKSTVFPLAGLWVAFGLFFLLFQGLLTGLDTRLRDFWAVTRLRLQATENPVGKALAGFLPAVPKNHDVCLILIDDHSVLSVPGLYQGDRRVFARALRIIGLGKPRAIGIDLFFGSAGMDEEADQELADVVKGLGNVVLKAYRRGDQTITPPYPALAISGTVAPVYFRPFVDEAVRTVSLVFHPASGHKIPGFHTELARLFFGVGKKQLNITPERLELPASGSSFAVPLLDEEFGMINYQYGLRDFSAISFAQVLQAGFDPGFFKDRLVLIGSSHSMSEDRHFTPLGGPEYSIFVHAQIVQNFLNRSFVQPFFIGHGYLLGLCALLVGTVMILLNMQPLHSLLLTFGLNIGLLFGSGYLFLWAGRAVDVMPALLSLFASFVLLVGKRYYAEHSEKLLLKNAFQYYVTASVMNEILKDPSKLKLHGEERTLTVFFSDIEGFTSLAEGMSPLVVVDLLNEYLTQMTEIIFRHDGLLDKYEGDAIMSVFGAPIDQTDHAVKACRCALEHQRVLVQLREKWRREQKPQMRVRIGINTGLVVVGNMGSKMRFDYTVIGDNVNLAARLETANKLFQSDILISGNTAELVAGKIVTRCLGMLKVAGRRQVIPVYEVLCCSDDPNPGILASKQEMKSVYEAGLNACLKREFPEAVAVLRPYVTQHPEDRPAVLLLRRCEAFCQTPPTADWDGTMVQEQK